MMASRYDYTETVKMLLEKDEIDVNAKNICLF